MLHLKNYCCSGPDHCTLKCQEDSKKHVCAIYNGAVHPICGIPNPEFEANKIGSRYSTICFRCHSKEDIKGVSQSTQSTQSTQSEKGVAFKRTDGMWAVSVVSKKHSLLNRKILWIPRKTFLHILDHH